MAIPKNKRRNIVVRGLEFEWSVSRIDPHDIFLPELYIRPKIQSLAALNFIFGGSTDVTGILPLIARSNNPEEGRHFDYKHFILTPKAVATIITWALDQNWQSSTASLLRATVHRDKGFQWVERVDGDWIAISSSDPK